MPEQPAADPYRRARRVLYRLLALLRFGTIAAAPIVVPWQIYTADPERFREQAGRLATSLLGAEAGAKGLDALLGLPFAPMVRTTELALGLGHPLLMLIVVLPLGLIGIAFYVGMAIIGFQVVFRMISASVFLEVHGVGPRLERSWEPMPRYACAVCFPWLAGLAGIALTGEGRTWFLEAMATLLLAEGGALVIGMAVYGLREWGLLGLFYSWVVLSVGYWVTLPTVLSVLLIQGGPAGYLESGVTVGIEFLLCSRLYWEYRGEVLRFS